MIADNVTVVGLQWGDEGKGKIVDSLARVCRYVVRFCGGANAGHTVKVGEDKFALHLIPSGILTRGVINVVGNGVVFDPATAFEEIEGLRSRNVAVDPTNLRISANAHVVMPWHKQQDVLSENSLSAGRKIGTTARGIGPCYADKANRSTAIRVAELQDAKALAEKVRIVATARNEVFAALYGAKPLDAEAITAEYVEYGRKFAPMIANTGAMLRRAIAAAEPILFEGAQGSLLDVDHGTYPFVTSSAVTACGVPSGAGVPPSAIGHVIGVVKAYTTRVGAGPMPTEQDNDTGNYLREQGHEYGTTTGRPRRCGWFDAFAVRYAAELSGVGEMALSLLDVLTGLDELKICTGYRAGTEELEDLDPAGMGGVECIYQTLAGWKEDISAAKEFQDLPAEAQHYVEVIEKLIVRPVGVISVGPERSQTIIHHSSLEGLA